MKKMIKFFKKRTWLFILIACLIFIPQSFSYQAKLNMRVLVSGLAIDKTENGYEVTAQVIMPSAGSEAGGMGARLDFISEEGASVADGIRRIAFKIGKTAALSHMSFVIIGESMLKDNLATSLDYFARDAQVNPSVMLLVCEGEAKETMKKTKDLELSVGVGLQKVFIYKQSSLNGIVMPMEAFINNAFSFSRSSLVSGIEIVKENEQSSSSGGSEGNQTQNSSSGSKSSSSSGQEEEKQARIKFYNDIYYFKNGEFVNKLSGEKEILGVFLADKISTSGEFVVEGVSGDALEEAIISVQFTNKKAKRNIDFKHNKLIFNLDINIKDVQVIGILNKAKPTVNIFDAQNQEIIKLIKESIKDEIESCVLEAFNKAKKDNVDIFDIGERAYQTKTQEWKKFYEENGENYLKNVEVKVNVSIKNVN